MHNGVAQSIGVAPDQLQQFQNPNFTLDLSVIAAVVNEIV